MSILRLVGEWGGGKGGGGVNQGGVMQGFIVVGWVGGEYEYSRALLF